GRICEEENILFVVDTAQTAGLLDIDFQHIRADALAFTGHKALLAPQGIGGFLISQDMAESMDALISGGTGSLSEYEEVPPYLPDKFEAGTPNLPGIYGLNQAIRYLTKVGLKYIREKELELAGILLEGFANMKGVRLAGLQETMGRMAVVSVDFEGYDNAVVAHCLDRDYGIRTRCGLHCAPSAHKTLGTFPQGTVRFSPGHFNTEQEMSHTLSAVQKVLKEIGSNRP
ncbi:MAG TPA: cysteine desulfurase, partial [Firmicutes bacterium]|nr:cysteine desulfurase [Bacillota bacterium]